jgi:hypothetical protein
MRTLALIAVLLLLTGCAGTFCATDYSGVERAPGSAAPDPHKPTGR